MRTATIRRETAETQIALTLDLDGSGLSSIATGVGFLDHMLTLLARHALIDLEVEAKGDLDVDDHHTVEDVGIALGQAVRQALGDKRASAATRLPSAHGRDAHARRPRRFGPALPGLPHRIPDRKDRHLRHGAVREWFQAFAINAGVTLHVETLYGANSHHIAESCFKGLARVLRQAVAIDPAAKDRVPSTKGTLSG